VYIVSQLSDIYVSVHAQWRGR